MIEQGGRLLVVVVCAVGLWGCAGLSGIGLKYEPDDVDKFHDHAVALKDAIADVEQRLGAIRKRLGAVARGQLTAEDVAGDILQFTQLASRIKNIPGKVEALLSSGKSMLTSAPTRYAGPQAMHLPKKVKLLKNAVAALEELPGRCKTLAVTTMELGRCVAGLPGDSSACGADAAGAAVASASGEAAPAVAPQKGAALSAGSSPAKRQPSTGTGLRGEFQTIVHPCSLVALHDPLSNLGGLLRVSPPPLARKGTLHFSSAVPDTSLRLKYGARVRTVKAPTVIQVPSFTRVQFGAAAPGKLPVLGQVVALPGRVRAVQLPMETAGTVLTVPYEKAGAHPVFIDGKQAGQTPFATCLTPGRVYKIRVGRALGPFSVYAKVGGKIILDEKALLERATSNAQIPGEKSSDGDLDVKPHEWVRLPKEEKKSDKSAIKQPEWARSTAVREPSKTSGKPRIRGGLTRTQINRGLHSVWHLVQKCHTRRRKRGWYRIEFTVNNHTGKVNIAMAKDSPNDPHTRQCLCAAVLKARFPAFDGGPRTVVFPFDFR